MSPIGTFPAGLRPGSVATTAGPQPSPPVTTAAASPAPNGAGWNNTNVTVTLSSTDNEPGGTGVKEIHYTLTGAETGGQVVSGSTATVAISAEGTTILTYVGVDNSGNEETPKTLILRIDKTPPVITVAARPSTLSPKGHKMVPVTIAGKITDLTSGVDASSASFAVTDEFGKVQPSGTVTLGADGSYSFTVFLEASLRRQDKERDRGEDNDRRRGEDEDKDRRRYTIVVSAKDNAGNRGSSSAVVIVQRGKKD